VVIGRHGNDASRVASERAETLLAEVAIEGRATFLRILDRIRQLKTTQPTGGVH